MLNPDPLYLRTFHPDVLLCKLHCASSFTHNSSFLGLFLYHVYNPFYLAAYKCTIKKCVVCNHRMWPKANSEQLLTCQTLILYDSATPQLNSTILPPPHPPECWNKQEEERKQVIHMSDTNLPQQIHNCSHWVSGYSPSFVCLALTDT